MSKKKKRILRSFMSLLLVFTMVFTGVIPVFAVGVGGNQPVNQGGAGQSSFANNDGQYSSYDPDDGVQAFVVDDAYGFKVRSTNNTVVTPFGTQDRKGGEACRKKYAESGDSMDMSNYYIFDASKNKTCGWTGTNFRIYNTEKQAYETIDVKVTLHDIETNGNDGNYIWLQNTTATPSINILGVEEVQMTIEYFVAGTQTPYTVNSNFTVSDIDAKQYFGFSSGNKTINQYAHPKSVLNYVQKNNLNIFFEPDDKEYDAGSNLKISAKTAAGGTYSASSYTFIFGSKHTRSTDKNGTMTSWAHFAFSAQSMADIATPAPYKTVSDTDNIKYDKTAGAETDVKQNRVESAANSWTYSVTQMVPAGKSEKFYYDSFVMSDQIESCLQINSVRIYSGSDDVTSSFSISTAGNKVTATANSTILDDSTFYGNGSGKAITMDINVSVKDVLTAINHKHYSNGDLVFTNTGHVTAVSSGKTYSNDTNQTTTAVQVPLAELTIDKVADKYEYKVGDTVTYTMKVTDITAGAPAYNTVFTDTIPSELQIMDVSTSGVTATKSVSGQDITVNATTLNPNQTLTVTVTCKALESGNAKELYNTAHATCMNIKNASGHADDDAETYINSAALTIDKVSDKYEYEVGDKATFTVKVKNTKGVANNVVVTDNLPDGMTLDFDSVQLTGLPKTVDYHVAGTADPTNQLNPDLRNEVETRNITMEKQKSGDNGWVYTINHMPADSEATITFTATANDNGNGKEQQNVVTAACDNAATVQDDSEYYINTADLAITKKYVNPYKEEKNDNRADNEFRVYEDVTGNELVQYVVDVTSSGVDGTVAKDVVINDLTLPDGMILNYDDITIKETAADGTQKEFTSAGGDGTTFKYHVAGTDDVTNQINEDKYNETEDRTPVITLTKSGNGFVLNDTYLESGSKLTIKYTAKATEDVNGMEVRNTATATAANIVKVDGKYKTVKADALVYINSPRLVITKKADSEDYAVGDTVTYTIDVSNRQTGTIARNLVFTDDILTEGVKLQKASIVLMDSDGKVIKETEENYSSDIQNNQFKLTTKKHLVKDANYSLWDIANGKAPEEQDSWNPDYIGVTKETSMRIEYQMIITDKDLAGKQIDNVATAVSDEALKVTTDESITPNPPDLDIGKEADKKVYYYGEDVNYHIEVTENRESVTAEDVIIKDQFAQADFAEIDPDSMVVKLNDQDITDQVKITYTEAKDGFTIETGLDITDSDKITVDYTATMRTDAIGQEITNTALTWGSNAPEKQATYTTTVEEDPPRLEITKTSDKQVYNIGETGHYTVKVTQMADNATARNVVIEDAMAISGTEISNIKVADVKGTDITGSVEITANGDNYIINTGRDLAQNESFTVTYDVLFKDEALMGHDDVTNTAKSHADNAEEVQAENTVKIPKPETVPEKTSDKSLYSLGETGHYSVVIHQTTDDAIANDVVITDKLGITGASLLPDTIKVADTEGNDITEQVEIIADETGYTINTGMDMSKEDTFTVTYDVIFDDESLVGQMVPNTVEVGGNMDENKVKVDAPELAINKVSDKEVYDVNETGHYTVEVTETKEDLTAMNVVIRDSIEDKGAAIVEGSIKLADADGNDLTEQVEITSDGTSYQINTNMNLAYGEKFVVTYDVTYTSESANATVRNVAQATADNLVTTTENEVTPVTYTDADGNVLFEVVKNSDPAPGTVVEAGQQITYTITAKNVTEEDLSNVLVMDQVPAMTEYVAESGGELREIGGLNYVCFTIDTLPAGGEQSVSFAVTVTDAASDQVENTALVRLAGEDDPAADETWNPETFVPTNTIIHPLTIWVEDDNIVEVQAPTLTIDKTSDKDEYGIGETGHYTVTVGQATEDRVAKNIVIKDNFDKEGIKLLGDTIHVLDPEGKDITSDVKIEYTDTSYYIETGRDLAYGETITVTYDVTFTDSSLAGQTVINTAKAKSDNAVVTVDNDVTPVDVGENLTAVKTADPASGNIVKAGQDITYHITVTNNGEEDKENVYVMDAIPALTTYVEGSGGEIMNVDGTDYVTFTIPAIAAGASETVSFTVTVSDQATEDDIIRNVALVQPSTEETPENPWDPDLFTPTNETEHPLDPWVDVDYPVDVDDGNPVLTIDKSSDKEVYKVGETGHYTVVVGQSKEDRVAENIIIKDEIQNDGVELLGDTIRVFDPEGTDITNAVSIEHDSKSYYIETGRDLAYGETFTVTYDVKFTDASLVGQTVINVAKAKADNASVETDNEVTPVDVGENLTALKTANPMSGTIVKAGDTIQYNITVSNNGEADKENVYIMDAIPALTTYVEGSGGEIMNVDGTDYVTFTIPSIAAGGSETVSFKVTISDEATEEDTIRNVALVQPSTEETPENPWDPDLFTPTNDTEHPLNPWVEDEQPVEVDNGNPTLTIEKTSDKDVYAVGETGHYTVTTKQTREDVTAENIVIKDELQIEGAKILADTIRVYGPDGADVTDAVAITTTDTSYYIETGMDLDYDEAITVTYDVLFEAESLNGQVVKNIAKAKADNAEAETDNEVTPVIVEEGLEALKTADPANGTIVKAGDTITYNIALTNTGAEDKTNVLVLDEIPALTTYVEGSGGTVVTIGDKQYVSFTVDSIPAGETANVSFQVVVSDQATEDDIIKNVALVKTAEGEDPQDPSTWNPDTFVPTNEVDHPLSNWVKTEENVTVDDGSAPRLVVTKTSDKDSYERKETGTYTITVTNDRENTTAENVVITDAFETTGMTIDQGSIKVTGPDGNAITPASITMNEAGNGFTIATGTSLAGGQSMKVTYNVTFNDKALIGEDVTNNVTVTSDNTDPSDATNTVKITKPDKDKSNTPDKSDNDGGKNGGSSGGSSGGSNRGSGSVQTSDIIITVLIAAAIVLVICGSVYFHKKKKAGKQDNHDMLNLKK